MDVHPTKNGINRYWSIPIWIIPSKSPRNPAWRPHVGVWHRNLHCGAGVATDCEGLWAVGLVAIEALARRWNHRKFMGKCEENHPLYSLYICISREIWDKSLQKCGFSMQKSGKIIYECGFNRDSQGLMGILTINKYGPNRLYPLVIQNLTNFLRTRPLFWGGSQTKRKGKIKSK
jgi:hypothetical protein